MKLKPTFLDRLFNLDRELTQNLDIPRVIALLGSLVLLAVMLGFNRGFSTWEWFGVGLIFLVQGWNLSYGFNFRWGLWEACGKPGEAPGWFNLFLIGFFGYLGILVFHNLGWFRGVSDVIGPAVAAGSFAFLHMEKREWVDAFLRQRRVEEKMLRWTEDELPRRIIAGDFAFPGKERAIAVKIGGDPAVPGKEQTFVVENLENREDTEVRKVRARTAKLTERKWDHEVQSQPDCLDCVKGTVHPSVEGGEIAHFVSRSQGQLDLRSPVGRYWAAQRAQTDDLTNAEKIEIANRRAAGA
jgi:hypothetical protein